jgi:hypothetical protein
MSSRPVILNPHRWLLGYVIADAIELPFFILFIDQLNVGDCLGVLSLAETFDQLELVNAVCEFIYQNLDDVATYLPKVVSGVSLLGMSGRVVHPLLDLIS